jgi:hypothetical protein
MRRYGSVVVAALVTLVAAAACGTSNSGDDKASMFKDRAANIATNWQSSDLKTVWQNGFVPLQPLTDEGRVAYVAGVAAEQAKQALVNGWYKLAGTLPDAPAHGTITFADGSTLDVALAGAQQAYQAIDHGDAPSTCTGAGCNLTVTKATLGTMTMATSRGQAAVPAWVFTVAELTSPVSRVAVAPVSVHELPTAPAGDPDPAHWLTGVGGVAGSSAGKTLTLSYTGGSCDTSATGQVYETDQAVVVGVLVTVPTGVCDLVAQLRTVPVALAKPLGARVLLDGLTGAPIVLNACGPGDPQHLC